MSTFAFPWIAISILVTASAGAWVARAENHDRARMAAVVVTATLVLVGLLAAGWIYGPGASRRWADPLRFSFVGQPRPVFALEALGGALLPFSAVVVLAVLLGASRGQLSAGRAGAALLQLAASWMLFTALDLGVMVGAWALGLIPALPARREGADTESARRIYIVYLLGSALLLAIAVVSIAVAADRAGVQSPLSLLDLEATGGLRAWGAMPLLLVAVVMRKGAFPFHSWIPALAERLGPAALVLLTAPQVGAFVLVRVAIPLFPGAIAEALPLLARVALVAALYGAVVALAARNLRRAFGWLVASQSALVLVGLECTTADGIAGGLTLWISVGLALTGLALAISAVEARLGRPDLERFWGLDARAPWLGATFLVLGLATVGLPGSLGFVAEDLLVHGVLESYPGIGAAIVVATACNGFTVLRCFARTFYGPARRACVVSDVLPRERLALVGLVLIVLGLGLVPGPIVRTRVPTASSIASMLAAASDLPGAR